MNKTLDEQVQQSAIRVATADLRAENARLQALVAAMELAHSLVRDNLEDECDGYKALAERRREALTAIRDKDWLKLIDMAGLPNDKEMGLLVNYELEGDYEIDARHIYPRIMELIGAAARTAIAITPEEAREKERR
jgi:hypothetical protein